MPKIPTYNQQTSAQGSLQVRPGEGGEIPGRILSSLGAAVGGVSNAVSSTIGQKVMQEEAVRKQVLREEEAQRIADYREKQRVWATSAL